MKSPVLLIQWIFCCVCKTVFIMTRQLIDTLTSIKHDKAAVLLLTSCTLLLVALLTNHWFFVEPNSYHGIWFVTFCDFLVCQQIPVLENDAPGWYVLVQVLSLITYTVLVGTCFCHLSPLLLGIKMCAQPAKVAVGCLLSAILTAATVATFCYCLWSELTKAPKYNLTMSWSCLTALLSFGLDILAAYVLLVDHGPRLTMDSSGGLQTFGA